MVKGLFVLIVAAVAFVIYALIDCLFTERHRFRALNKPVWVLIIVILPLVGALLWFGLGRRRRSSANRRMIAPDDDPAFSGRGSQPMRGFDRESVDERIRRLEQDLAEHDDDGPTGKLK